MLLSSSFEFSAKSPGKIVTQVSAGFLRQEATMLSGTDHHSICKFESEADGSFSAVALEMLKLLKLVRKGLSTMDFKTVGSQWRRVSILSPISKRSQAIFIYSL
jgi:hypothetical protein